MPVPHQDTTIPAVTSRRGQFWVPGDTVATSTGTAQRGPMFVQWEAPEPLTGKRPLVLVHGGGGQGTDWLGTVDGRPGWAHRFVEAGFPVYVVDRPGHGRSPYHPEVIGEMGAPFSYEAAVGLFAPPERAEEQSAWAWGRDPGDEGLDQLVAAFGPLPADLGYSQELDADRLSRLLDRIGPAILVTHSAGGPVGWLAADRRPQLVKAIVSVEPMGPAFVEFPGMGALEWGLTAAPVTYDPPLESAQAVREAEPETRRIPGLENTAVLIVTGGASPFADFADEVVTFLQHAGASAERMHLPDEGTHGNGHGLLMEANAEQACAPVIRWLLHWDENDV
ncbi:alpha/beta hydrolase [Kocuria dechangensis]|uniref:Alpha/beta hydrolase n=1 Tax=Kocuria dechangensis TaxID=1176249 RepID=A0A917GXE2_9MICC|nr:alpha/beta fold hydrolase [Kocuria dechangensis]GGG60061.1 alpha/beta hydrolase [Kocuria dechangensis]